MKCIKCGGKLNESDKFCPSCGNGVNNTINDSGSSWYFVLGLFLPLVATILYCIYSKEKPQTSKKLMIGFIVGYVFKMIAIILLIFTFFFYSVMPIGDIKTCSNTCDGHFSYTNGKCVCTDQNDTFDDDYDFDDFKNNFYFD